MWKFTSLFQGAGVVYKIFNETAFGYRKDLSIPSILEEVPAFFDGVSLLLTCVDSSNKVVAHLDPEYLLSKGITYSAHLGSMLINAEFAEAFKNNYDFSGFDELYLLSENSNLLKYAITEHFTSDGYEFGNEIPNDFLKIFNEMGAIRYLSDGCGLNYACEPIFAEQIENLPE